MKLSNFESLREQARHGIRQTLAVVEAADCEVIEACVKAKNAGIADSIFIGDTAKISEAAETHKLDISGIELLDSLSPEQSVKKAAGLIAAKRASMIMKGHLDTAVLMKGVLDKESGLRTGHVLSHVMVAEAKNLGRWLMMTDAGLNIAPDAEMMVSIIRNAISVAHSLGIEIPKVAVLSAVEKVNPKIPSTVLADDMKNRGVKGDFPGGLVEGPMAIDLALSEHAVIAKDYKTNGVAGHADILVVPELVSGNVLGKSFIYCAGYRCSGLIVGAKVPIVLLSRSDTAETKLDSITLACVYALNAKHTS